MLSFENIIQKAVQEVDLPGAVVVGSDASGQTYFANAFGVRSLEKGKEEPMSLDAVFWLASSTKLMTVIAALQCVERGRFTLDEDVTRLLPELKDIDILTGFEEGTEEPILVRSKKTITLRHLLTHTSGLSYDVFNPLTARWRLSRGEIPTLNGRTILERNTTPLLFEPGESFEYSTGIDWAGQMVERTNNMPLQSYMQKFIWEPIGIKDLSFHLDQRPDMFARLIDMSERQGGSTLFGTPADASGEMKWTAEKVWTAQGMLDDAGGAGGYAVMTEYQKILQSMTVNDGKLLGSTALDELFRPQLSEWSQAQLDRILNFKDVRDIMTPGVPAGTKIGYSLGGAIVLEDLPGRRREGSMSWSGLPNIFWWVDRSAGVNGVYGSQVIPSADPKSIDVFAEFEKALYAKVQAE